MKIPTEYKLEAVICKDPARMGINRGAEICDVDTVTGAATLVATDGHVLAAVPIRLEEDPGKLSGPVSAEALTRARKLAKSAKVCESDVKVSTVAYTFSDGSTAPRTLPTEGQEFPDWHQIVEGTPTPDAPGSFELAFDLSLLCNLAEALGDRKGTLVLTVRPEPPDTKQANEVVAPIHVQLIHGDSKAFGLLMPVRP